MAVTDQTRRAVPAGWAPATTSDEDGRPLELLLAADGVGGEGSPRAVLARPRLVRRGQGDRALSVSVVLTRPPAVGEALEPLLERVALAVELETLPPAAALAATSAEALVPRGTNLALLRGDRTLAEVALSGPARAGALQATLDREDGLAVLAAVEDRPCDLVVRAELAHRGGGAATGPVRLRFDLAAVAHRLEAVADEAGRFLRADLRHYVRRMLDDGTVRAEPTVPPGAPLADELLDAFLRGAGPLLKRLAEPADPMLGESFELRASAAVPMDVTAATSGTAAAAQAVVAIEAGLGELLADVRAAGAIDRCVSIVAPGAGGLEPVRAVAARRRAGPPSDGPLVADGERIGTRWAAVRAAAAGASPAHALLATGALRLEGRQDLFAMTDAIAPVEDGAPAGPLLDDAATSIWPDRSGDGTLWYAPSFALVSPDPATATPASTPALFRFRTAGHDAEGRPFLEATLRVTLDRRMPDPVRADWEARGRPELRPVDAGGLSIELRVPYVDETKQTRVQAIPSARITDGGAQVVVEFDILGNWARVAYGALSKPGFQDRSASLSVAYTFSAWHTMALPWHLGPARLRVPALERPRAMPDGVVGRMRFAAGTLELRRPGLDRLRPELPPIRPEIEPWPGGEVEVEPRPRVRKLRRTHVHADELELLLPCATLGSLYVQEVDGDLRAIGCQDAMALGQAPRQVFEEVPLSSPADGTRVLRNLTTPGRFVVVPGRFRIGRYEPTDGTRAFKPAVMLYSTVDAVVTANSRCVVAADLQPDLSLAQLAAIERELRADHHPQPVAELVTRLPGTESIGWALPQGPGWTVTDASRRTTDGFTVMLTTDIAGVLGLQRILVNGGVRGAATFDLGDGTSARSDLHLELDRIVGPASTGPVTVEHVAGAVRLRNAIDAPVAVSDLLVGPEGSPVAVDAVLQPGATRDVAVPDGTAVAIPVCEAQSTPASLEEIRAYVEDITFEVRFVGLVDLAAQGLTGLEIVAHMRGDEREERARLNPGDTDVGVTFVASLTQYAAERVLEFRVDRLGEGGAVAGSTETVSWPLDTKGHLVDLTDELVLGPPGPH